MSITVKYTWICFACLLLQYVISENIFRYPRINPNTYFICIWLTILRYVKVFVVRYMLLWIQQLTINLIYVYILHPRHTKSSDQFKFQGENLKNLLHLPFSIALIYSFGINQAHALRPALVNRLIQNFIFSI